MSVLTYAELNGIPKRQWIRNKQTTENFFIGFISCVLALQKSRASTVFQCFSKVKSKVFQWENPCACRAITETTNAKHAMVGVVSSFSDGKE